MFCQKCRTPLKLDGSLEDLNPAAYDLLVGQFSALASPSQNVVSSELTGDRSNALTATSPQASLFATSPATR